METCNTTKNTHKCNKNLLKDFSRTPCVRGKSAIALVVHVHALALNARCCLPVSADPLLLGACTTSVFCFSPMRTPRKNRTRADLPSTGAACLAPYALRPAPHQEPGPPSLCPAELARMPCFLWLQHLIAGALRQNLIYRSMYRSLCSTTPSLAPRVPGHKNREPHKETKMKSNIGR